MFVVDTNVLVYAANADAPEHGRCRALLEGWRAGRDRWYTTWAILYEFTRVVTHPRVFPNPWSAEEALAFADALIETQSHGVLVASERHTRIARELARAIPGLGGNLMHDFHTAVLMREHGLSRIYTRDADFHRFDFIEVVEPLA
ncbi:MAG TPA: TA system VapC family ribonuclease toxin [Longimicrobiaceae bacterium]|nr:TA system VapC family ribonuclease toxin [Longimicrobiaceae bacterium]